MGLTDERAARRAAPKALELDAGYNDFRGFFGLRLTDERACQFVQKRAHRATRLCRSLCAPTALEPDDGYNDFEELFLNWEFFYIAGVV